jgi:hypothetical protein
MAAAAMLACFGAGYAAPGAAQAGTAVGDFDGDGFVDLAIGAPGEDSSGIEDVGSVNVIFGDSGGLSTSGDLVLAPGLQSGWPAQARSRFGAALAVGDFNGDGRADLAIGAPGQASASGRVYVAYGSSTGFTNTQGPIRQAQLRGLVEAGDEFGFSLAAGDFNGDGRDDLAIGVPGQVVRTARDAGVVNVVYGSRSGLGPRNELWHQNTPGIDDSAEPGDRFGAALAASDFGRSNDDDLAIGVPGEDLPAGTDAGAVAVLYGGGVERLTPRDDQLWHQDVPAIEDSAEAGDRFGSSLAVGDFNGPGPDDLAIGVPAEDIGPAADAGGVAVVYGTATEGLRPEGDQFWHQDAADVEDTAEAGDRLGGSLAAGQLDGDGFADLAAGVAGEDVDGLTDAGAVTVLYGSATGISAARDQWWSQDTQEILDQGEAEDGFGTAVAIGAFGGDTRPGLAVGVPGEDRSQQDSGAITVIYANASGLATPGNQFWEQDTLGIEGESETGDGFGSTLAPGQRTELSARA